MADKVTKSDAEWRAALTPEQFHVTRKKGTERAFSGKLWDEHRDGMYACVCCGAPLFDAATKFDSGTGWPSFYAPMARENVAEKDDSSFFMRAHRGRVRGVRRAPRPRLPGWSRADGAALLHELGSAQVRTEDIARAAPQDCGARLARVGPSQRMTRAPLPFITASTSAVRTIDVSPGVVMASAPCAAPYSTASCGLLPARNA